MKKSDFVYSLPDELIAQKPLPERSASRMLCVNACKSLLVDKKFTDFIDLINANDLLVFNNTKVMPARLFGTKATGGKVEILIERIIGRHQALAHMRASKAARPGAIINLDDGYTCEVVNREADLFRLKFFTEPALPQLLEQIGHMPLPPYIQRLDDAHDLERYQTVFAQQDGAVAAPTAGLHFDDKILQEIRQKNIQNCFVTLHVGSGTFQPVRVENLTEHVMHKEYYEVPQATVDSVKMTRANGGKVIAIGTTAVRALESAAQTGNLQPGFGDTDLFITPGYGFNAVDALLTNFHLPGSTLLMLVSAFAGHEVIMAAYQHAIAKRYRFFSYGDAMYIGKGQ